MKKRLTNKEIADKHRLDFMAQSDDDINHFAISVMGDSFTTVGEHVKKEAKKLVDSQPF
jgi:hypothetical protein